MGVFCIFLKWLLKYVFVHKNATLTGKSCRVAGLLSVPVIAQSRFGCSLRLADCITMSGEPAGRPWCLTGDANLCEVWQTVLCREEALFDELLGNLDGVGGSPFA